MNVHEQIAKAIITMIEFAEQPEMSADSLIRVFGCRALVSRDMISAVVEAIPDCIDSKLTDNRDIDGELLDVDIILANAHTIACNMAAAIAILRLANNKSDLMNNTILNVYSHAI